MRVLTKRICGFSLVAVLVVAPVTLDAQVRTVPVRDGVYMLVGQGGNIGLSVGQDGAFLIDDQFAPLTEAIRAAIGELTDLDVRFVVNTHFHSDHTDGNENLGEGGAIIVAHESVRERLTSEQFVEVFDISMAPYPPAAPPVVTFNDRVTFHWNGDEIKTFHVPHAHSDGDVLIHFVEANAFHMGDTYFAGVYPFIDVANGGGIRGMIESAERVIAVSDSESLIIPGHGALSNREELVGYRDMLITVRDRVQKLMNDGLSLDEVVASRPTADLDEQWQRGPIQSDVFVRLVFRGLAEGR